MKIYLERGKGEVRCRVCYGGVHPRDNLVLVFVTHGNAQIAHEECVKREKENYHYIKEMVAER